MSQAIEDTVKALTEFEPALDRVKADAVDTKKRMTKSAGEWAESAKSVALTEAHKIAAQRLLKTRREAEAEAAIIRKRTCGDEELRGFDFEAKGRGGRAGGPEVAGREEMKVVAVGGKAFVTGFVLSGVSGEYVSSSREALGRIEKLVRRMRSDLGVETSELLEPAMGRRPRTVLPRERLPLAPCPEDVEYAVHDLPEWDWGPPPGAWLLLLSEQRCHLCPEVVRNPSDRR